MWWRVSSTTKILLAGTVVLAIGTAIAAIYTYWFNGSREYLEAGEIGALMFAVATFATWIMTPPTLQRIPYERDDDHDDHDDHERPTIH